MHLRTLLDQRDALDAEIAATVMGNGTKRERAPQKCSVCQAEGHTARTCPQKQA